MTDETLTNPISDDVFVQHRNKLADWRKTNQAYPNQFRRNTLAKEVLTTYEQETAESLACANQRVCLAGRILLKRDMGKSLF